MSKEFSCRTCGWLRTFAACKRLGQDCIAVSIDRDRDGKAVLYYECDGMDGVYLDHQVTPVDTHFCALHTDREAVKRIREGL